MNTLPVLSITPTILTCTTVATICILAIIFMIIMALKYGPSMSKEHDEFITRVRGEFPGCTLLKEEHCEVIVKFEDSRYIVKQDYAGELLSKPYKPEELDEEQTLI